MSRAGTAPSEADSVVREVFLTPRVIDENAFGRYSAALSELILEGRRMSERLRAERERAELVFERGAGGVETGEDSASATRIARLEATVAELAGRLEQAEAKADEARREARAAGGRERAHKEDDYEGTSAGSELPIELDEALARAKHAEARLGELVERAEHAGEELNSKIGDVIQKAAAQGSELTAMVMMLAEQCERAEALKGLEELSDESLKSLVDVIERARGAVSAADEQVERLQLTCAQADESGEALLKAVRSATEGAVSAERVAARLGELLERGRGVERAGRPSVPMNGTGSGSRAGGPAGFDRPSPLAPELDGFRLQKPVSPIDGEDFSGMGPVIRRLDEGGGPGSFGPSI
ncbi:MAG: hypothetical protein ACF8Q5_06340 [Phycisphaerales bacterium JB040]